MKLKELQKCSDITTCRFCGIKQEQIRTPYLQRLFSNVQYTNVFRYSVPCCRACANTLLELNVFLLNLEYEKYIEKPYTYNKILECFLDYVVEMGFFVKISGICISNTMVEMDKKFSGTNANPEEIDKYLVKVIESSPFNEYLELSLTPLVTGPPPPQLQLMGFYDDTDEDFVGLKYRDLLTYPAISHMLKHEPILQTRFIIGR